MYSSRSLLRAMSTAKAKNICVKHDKHNNVFYVEIPDCAEKAILTYEKIDSRSIDFQHTVVPEAFRGQGIGKLLAKAAFKYVVENDLRMKLTCWFLQKYAGENPDEEHEQRRIP